MWEEKAKHCVSASNKYSLQLPAVTYSVNLARNGDLRSWYSIALDPFYRFFCIAFTSTSRFVCYIRKTAITLSSCEASREIRLSSEISVMLIF